jgi:hypothetical protein
VHGSAKDTRVEVASRTADLDEYVHKTAKTVGDTRSASVEPVVIRLSDRQVSETVSVTETYNADGVDAMEPAVLSPGMLCSDEFVEADASTFLHSFEDEA